MWRPTERIKHEVPVTEWPTAEQAAGSRWFSPVQVGPVELEQRTWVPAMVPWRATENGYVTPEILDWYERFAQGRPGAIVVEATGVRDIASGPLLRIGHDRFVPGLQQLVETVRRASDGHTRLFIQLIDFLVVRRRPERERFFREFLVIDDGLRSRCSGDDESIREQLVAMPDEDLDVVLSSRQLESFRYGYRERVTDTDLPHVDELPKVLPGIFAAAAGRAEAAGFDGVELHYAHAYTMASFLSATNTRQDGYGGSIRGRLKLPLEVFRAVRAEVSNSMAIGCRYLSEECVDSGSGIDDAEAFGVAFAGAGMDYLSLSRGGKFDDAEQPRVGRAVYPYTGPSGYECMPTVVSDVQGPFGRNADPTARVRAAVRSAGHDTPIVVAGGICSFEQAESLLEGGDADIVAAARQSLADPDWLRKIRAGMGDQVRRCIYTNYCEGLDQLHKQVTCQLWDRSDLDDPDVCLSEDGKRRLIAPPSPDLAARSRRKPS